MSRLVLSLAVLFTAHLAFAGQSDEHRLTRVEKSGTLTLSAVAPDVLRIDYVPHGVKPRPTEMMDLRGLRRAQAIGQVDGNSLATSQFRATISDVAINITAADKSTKLGVFLAYMEHGGLAMSYGSEHPIYGLRGVPIDRRNRPGSDLTSYGWTEIRAGTQGNGGAPLAYTNRWGLFVDTIDGEVTNRPGTFVFSGGSRKDLEAYIVIGPPRRTLAVATDLTGHPPMPPKWSLGFMNSQWKTDERTVTDIVDEYRRRKIPLDAFIFDFDFKAWGEDDYGEWRWNSTNGPGNVGPMKYPNGANGKFGAAMAAKGVKLVGIMKPRILIQNVNGHEMKAAVEADAHHWWMPGKKPYTDYFSHRLANDLDFSNPMCRLWYWQHAKGLFDTGIVGWWNDEADDNFPSLGFFHMQQSLYEGQRHSSKLRVWSLNRNFYLGAQRFGFGTWSGDINTGFDTMAYQAPRMLSIIDLGQPHWSMDTGGFGGHPSDENYARWMEFASVVPIMRVHSTYGERRQPWVYGPEAQAAAEKAINWRYSMLPSLYSWEHDASKTGLGIVRPLNIEFPDDPGSAELTNEWMLGDQLLVAPVLAEGARKMGVYLPPGDWVEYSTDKSMVGGTTIDVDLDSTTWKDLPMYVRSGSILATQPAEQFVGDRVVDELTLDVWPSATRTASFHVYDDDGSTYDYEHGAYFDQEVRASITSKGVEVVFAKPTGSYRTHLKSYKVRIHRSLGDVAIVSYPTKQATRIVIKN